MDYNTQRKRLELPEYGRNIQMMVDHLSTIEDRDERTLAAKTIISVMGNLYPHLRDVPDFRHKLWDHLTIMSNFNLDIDAPYPLPKKNVMLEKPEKVSYQHHRIKYRHYGLLTEKLVELIKEIDDIDQKSTLIVLTANHMKKSFLTWNKGAVDDQQIIDDLQTLYGEKFELPEGFTLSNQKDLLQRRTTGKAPGSRAQGRTQGGGRRSYHKKH